MHYVRKTAYTIHTIFFVFYRVAFYFCVEGGERIVEKNCVHDFEFDCEYAKDLSVSYCIHVHRERDGIEVEMNKLEKVGRRARERGEKSDPNDQFTFERFKPSFILFRPRTIHSAHLLLPTKPFECVSVHVGTGMCGFLFEIRNGIRSKSIFRCSFHSSAMPNTQL